MAALTNDRSTPAKAGDVAELPVLAATTHYGGGIVMLNAAGFAVPGATATGQIAAGRCDRRADNSAGANGDINVKTRRGIFRWGNSAAADEITAAEVGDDCYIVDDQTVAKTDGTASRSIAGKVMDVDAQGVWVKIGIA